MKKMLLLAGVAAMFAANQATAQETVVSVVSEDVVLADLNPTCGEKYFSTKSSNWFLEIGGGGQTAIVERGADKKPQFTANYAVGFGKWFSPYFGWRIELNGGSVHWNTYDTAHPMAHMKSVNGNLDIMWDMFNSIGNVHSRRVFSIVPFIGLGGTFNWKYKYPTGVIPLDKYGKQKDNEWLLPVSAGLQFRFRLCKYVDFFAQARAAFYGDSYNNNVEGRPVDINLSAIGGFTFNLGGADFKSYNPCDYIDYINGLNNQINFLRGDLASTQAALAAALAQLPCPEVTETVVVEESAAPLLSTVRFTIDSSRISNTEKVNVYNVAQWMKNNDDQKVLITGYADKDTGTSSYNMALSERRAKAVYNMLVNEYGIAADRLATKAEGSDVQPYNVNNWNRIVVFSVQE